MNSSTLVAWSAGFFDGEGCIQIRQMGRVNGNRLNLSVCIGQKHEQPLKIIQEMFGGSISKSKQGYYRLDIVAKQAESALRAMLPYLIVKKIQAELALEFRERMPKKGNKNTPESVWLPLYEIRDAIKADKHKEIIWERV